MKYHDLPQPVKRLVGGCRFAVDMWIRDKNINVVLNSTNTGHVDMFVGGIWFMDIDALNAMFLNICCRHVQAIFGWVNQYVGLVCPLATICVKIVEKKNTKEYLTSKFLQIHLQQIHLHCLRCWKFNDSKLMIIFCQ